MNPSVQQVEHALERYGHWLVLALLGVTETAQKIQPGALNADVHNDVQMAMLVLGSGTVAAILRSAWVQRAVVLAQGVGKAADATSRAAGTVAGAIQAAQHEAPKP